MRTRTFAAVVAVLVALLALGGGILIYDDSRAHRVAEGVRVGGIDVGGLRAHEVADRLRAELIAPLYQPVVVRAAGRTFRLGPRRSRVHADLGAMIDEAMERGREDGLLTRVARDLTGGRVDADLEPAIAFDERAVRRLVARVRRAVDRPARDARVELAAEPVKIPSRQGRRLAAADLEERIKAALVRPEDRKVRARVRTVEPETTLKDLQRRYTTLVTIDRGAYRLRLYKRLKLRATYPIAVGQAGVETPAGRYDIQNKAVDPTWHVPNSAWAGELAGRVIPPGPENPLKARWLGIYDGAGIHGTAERGSIGTNASHGCIRMLVEDVIELYDRVPVGAAVYIA